MHVAVMKLIGIYLTALCHSSNRFPFRRENVIVYCECQKLRIKNWDLLCFAPSVFTPPVTIYMLLYSTLLYKKIAPGGRKTYKLETYQIPLMNSFQVSTKNAFH